MPAKKKVDYEKLIKMVESGTPQADIMKTFKFNTAAQFKNHYLDGLMQAGKAPAITTRKAAAGKPSSEVFVSKRGSAVIPKDMIQEMGFAEGDTFAVRKTKSGISLKKL